MTVKMKVKFNKYFGKCRKFESVQFAFKKFYGLKAAETYSAPIRNAFNNVLDYYKKELGM